MATALGLQVIHTVMNKRTCSGFLKLDWHRDAGKHVREGVFQEGSSIEEPKGPHKHKDPTDHGFWNPRCLGPKNQTAGSFCLYGSLAPLVLEALRHLHHATPGVRVHARFHLLRIVTCVCNS